MMSGRTVTEMESDALPTKKEVSSQLERMLADPIFKSRPKQAEVLAYIVKSELAGREISEKSIRDALFPYPPYEPEKNHVRVTVTYVRNRIQEYYEGPGTDDPIAISLPTHKVKPPPGTAYKPLFRYSLRGVAAEHYRRGLHHLSELPFHANIGFALRSLEEANEAAREYGPARAALAETQLLQAFFTFDIPPTAFLAEAEESARESLLLNNNLWQAHVIQAAVHCSRWNWKEASDSISTADEIAKMTDQYDAFTLSPWRAAMAMANCIEYGRREGLNASSDSKQDSRPLSDAANVLHDGPGIALETMRRRAKRSPGNVFATCLYALFLYAVGDQSFDLVFTDIRRNGDTDHWIFHVVSELSDIASGRKRDSSYFPVPELPYDVDYLPILRRDAYLTIGAPGLAIAFAATRGMYPEAHRRLVELECAVYVRPFQLALAHLGLGNHRRAVEELLKAAEERDPFLVWIHLWPLFNSLRPYPEFNSLLERMASPAR
jgi:hypothetical protein